MSMPALQFDDEAPYLDPDELKVPESAAHRQMVDVIGLAAATLVEPDHRVFRDMNWYPDDGGGPVAPDVMVLPSSATEARPRSYRQDRDGGPPARAVVEVPSVSDSFASFLGKAQRYQMLGTVTYLVVLDTPEPAVLRLAPGDRAPVDWVGRPIEEMGGIRLTVDGDVLEVITPSGGRATRDTELLDLAVQLARDEADQRAAAERRIAELEQQLRDRGEEPPPTATT